MKITKLLALMLSLSLVAGTLQAKPDRDGDDSGFMEPGRGHHGKKHFEKMIKELNLTKEQQEKAKALKEARKGKMKASMEKMRPLHEELRTLLEADKVDMSKVRTQLEKIAALQVDLRLSHIEGRLEFEAILTPEQKAKLKTMHKKRQDERKKHHDKKQKEDQDD